MGNELKDFINSVMPEIDDILSQQETPIPRRFYAAADLFIQAYVAESSFCSKKDLLYNEYYSKHVLPIFNDWYFEKYGELTENPTERYYSGVALVYGQPSGLKIPITTGEIVEEGVTSKMMFPDHLQKSENIKNILSSEFDLEKMKETELKELTEQIRSVVALTRTLNLDLSTAINLDIQAQNMSRGIWSHFEKSISDILSFKRERAAIACWELHLAMEKALKVTISSKTKKSMHGHDLHKLAHFLRNHVDTIDISSLSQLPTDKEAIQLRYGEIVRQPTEAYEYYLVALNFVASITRNLDRKYKLNNASFTLKKAPWAR